MLDNKTSVKLSKFLSLVLRHKPETIGIQLSENGWVATETLIQNMNAHGQAMDFETLNFIVENNNKKRFSFNEDKLSLIHI